MNQNPFWKKIFSLLRIRPLSGGLEISDNSLRFAYFDGSSWKFAGLRLPPGVIREGDIKDEEKFMGALMELRNQILGEDDKNRFIEAVVSLSSVNVYSQVFSLPIIEGENLEKAVQLNIQMVSPGKSSETYSGWQLVGKDQKSLRLEIMSAFINRAIVDKVNQSLKKARFLVHSIESKAIALVRFMKEVVSGFDKEKPYIVITLDNKGIEFLVIRNAQLYFQYSTLWSEIQGSERQISITNFETVVVRNLHQVLNYYNSHWPEPLTEIFILTDNLKDQLIKVVAENFSLKVNLTELSGGRSVASEWFVSMGSGLRSIVPRSKDAEISLLGISAQDEYRQNQLVEFINFWRILIPIALGVLLLVFIGSDVFLTGIKKNLESKMVSGADASQIKEMNELKQTVQDFNRSINLISKAEQSAGSQTVLLNKVNGLLRSNDLILSRLARQGEGSPINVSGWAKSEDQILNFKKALDNDPSFKSVNLPLSDIKPGSQGLFFSVSFLMASSTAK